MAQHIEDMSGPKPESNITHLFPQQESVEEQDFEPRLIYSSQESPHPYTPGPNRDEYGFKLRRSARQQEAIAHRWEEIDPDGSFSDELQIKKRELQEKPVSKRTHHRHTTKPKFPDVPVARQKSQAELARIGAERYIRSKVEEDERASRLMRQAQERLAAKRAAIQNSEVTQARQGLLDTLKKRARQLPLPFRRK